MQGCLLDQEPLVHMVVEVMPAPLDQHRRLMPSRLDSCAKFADTEDIRTLSLCFDSQQWLVLIGYFHPASFVSELDLGYAALSAVEQRRPTCHLA